MFGNHRSLLVRHIGPLLVVVFACLFLVLLFFWGGGGMESCLFEVFPCLLFFSKTAPRCSDPDIYFFFCGIFKVCTVRTKFWN